MPEIIKVIFLAVIQGISEFLPISSSGHLAIFSRMFDIDPESSLLLAIVLHAGTLLAILIFYFHILKEIVFKFKINILLNVFLGSIPIVIAGITLHLTKTTDFLFNNMYFPGIGLLITGVILIFGHKPPKSKMNDEKNLEEMKIKDSLIIGFFQGLAILPGISRSGSTIASALTRNVKKEDAATFSFLLAVPAITGALVIEIISKLLKNQSLNDSNNIETSLLVLGFAISGIVGYISLRLLLKTLKKNSLAGYGYYCLSIGMITITYQLLTSTTFKFF